MTNSPVYEWLDRGELRRSSTTSRFATATYYRDKENKRRFQGRTTALKSTQKLGHYSSLSTQPQRNLPTIFIPGSTLRGSSKPSFVCSHEPLLSEATSVQRPEVVDDHDDDVLIHFPWTLFEAERIHVGRLDMRLSQGFESLRDVQGVAGFRLERVLGSWSV